MFRQLFFSSLFLSWWVLRFFDIFYRLRRFSYSASTSPEQYTDHQCSVAYDTNQRFYIYFRHEFLCFFLIIPLYHFVYAFVFALIFQFVERLFEERLLREHFFFREISRRSSPRAPLALRAARFF